MSKRNEIPLKVGTQFGLGIRFEIFEIHPFGRYTVRSLDHRLVGEMYGRNIRAAIKAERAKESAYAQQNKGRTA